VTPQTTWPMIRSPVAKGPSRYWWAALTVIEPSALTICSLKTQRKVSVMLPMWRCPSYVVLGAGFVGRVTVTGSWSGLSPLSVTSVPPVIVVEPLAPLSDAVQVLARLLAVKLSWPDAPTFAMLAELVTDPVGPSVPEVLTSMRPEEKIVAGPASARADAALALWGLFEASDASVTDGVGAAGVHELPKASTVQEWPYALPLTEVTSTSADPCPTPNSSVEELSSVTASDRRNAPPSSYEP